MPGTHHRDQRPCGLWDVVLRAMEGGWSMTLRLVVILAVLGVVLLIVRP